MGDLTDHLSEKVLACEGSRGIVHADDRCVGRNRSETVANRLASRGPTGNTSLTGNVLGWNHDDDPVAHRLCGVDRPVKYPLVGDQCVLFLTAESGTCSRCDDNRPNNFFCCGCHDE